MNSSIWNYGVVNWLFSSCNLHEINEISWSLSPHRVGPQSVHRNWNQDGDSCHSYKWWLLCRIYTKRVRHRPETFNAVSTTPRSIQDFNWCYLQAPVDTVSRCSPLVCVCVCVYQAVQAITKEGPLGQSALWSVTFSVTVIRCITSTSLCSAVWPLIFVQCENGFRRRASEPTRMGGVQVVD